MTGIESELARNSLITCGDAPVLHILPSVRLPPGNAREGQRVGSLSGLPAGWRGGEQKERKKETRCGSSKVAGLRLGSRPSKWPPVVGQHRSVRARSLGGLESPVRAICYGRPTGSIGIHRRDAGGGISWSADWSAALRQMGQRDNASAERW